MDTWLPTTIIESLEPRTAALIRQMAPTVPGMAALRKATLGSTAWFEAIMRVCLWGSEHKPIEEFSDEEVLYGLHRQVYLHTTLACLARSTYVTMAPDLLRAALAAPIVDWSVDVDVPIPAQYVCLYGSPAGVGIREHVVPGHELIGFIYGRLDPELRTRADILQSRQLAWWQDNWIEMFGIVALPERVERALLSDRVVNGQCAVPEELTEMAVSMANCEGPTEDRLDILEVSPSWFFAKLFLFLALPATRCKAQSVVQRVHHHYPFKNPAYIVTYDGDPAEIVYRPELFESVEGGFLMPQVAGQPGYTARWREIIVYLKRAGYEVVSRDNGKFHISHPYLAAGDSITARSKGSTSTNGYLVDWIRSADGRVRTAASARKQEADRVATAKEKARRVQVAREAKTKATEPSKFVRPAADADEIAVALVGYLASSIAQGRYSFPLSSLQSAAYHRTNKKTVRDKVREALKQLIVRDILVADGTTTVGNRSVDLYALHPLITRACHAGADGGLITRLWNGDDPGWPEPDTDALDEQTGSALAIEEDEEEEPPVAAPIKAALAPVEPAVSPFNKLLIEVLGADLFDLAIEKLMVNRDYERLMQLVVYSNDEEKSKLIIQRIAEAKNATSS